MEILWVTQLNTFLVKNSDFKYCQLKNNFFVVSFLQVFYCCMKFIFIQSEILFHWPWEWCVLHELTQFSFVWYCSYVIDANSCEWHNLPKISVIFFSVVNALYNPFIDLIWKRNRRSFNNKLQINYLRWFKISSFLLW